jgi:polyhydroxybutyrate depolymerase
VRPISALYVLGTEDPFFPAAGDGTLLSFDSTLAFWGRHNQCGARRTSTALPDTAHDGTRVWRSAYSGCTGRAQVVLDSVVGGGHAWPGAVVPTNPATLGVTSRNLSTNDAIIRLLRGVAP